MKTTETRSELRDATEDLILAVYAFLDRGWLIACDSDRIWSREAATIDVSHLYQANVTATIELFVENGDWIVCVSGKMTSRASLGIEVSAEPQAIAKAILHATGYVQAWI